MEIVFNNLEAKIIGKIPEGTFLEGGDFFVAKMIYVCQELD